jgi:hypothetical protein
MPVGTNIPVKLYEVLIPILINILEDISLQVSDLALDSAMKMIESTIEGATPCNDLELRNLADKISKLKQRIDNFLNQLNKIQNISRLLQTIGGVARAISAVLTASGTPIAPAPLVKALQIISAVGINAASVAKLLSNILTQISLQLNSSIDKLNMAIGQLNRSCSDLRIQSYPNQEIIVNETDTGFLDKDINSSTTGIGSNTGQIPAGIGSNTGQIPDSLFYRPVNVSEDDINDRLDSYESLLNRQVDLLTAIKEAPSNILSGATDPTANDGYTGDYFINVTSGEIFGPKTQDGQWN